jgi:formamidopyrimidine-DNA glycosylase
VPELPEVEHTRRLLQRAMAGARIRRVILRRANLRYPFAGDFVGRLEGQRVRAVERRAKYLLVGLGSGEVLLMHLGMSGSFRIRNSRRGRTLANLDESIEPHDHVVFRMSNGRTVLFNDPRRFGFMTLLAPGEMSTHRSLRTLGPEPLPRGLDASALARTLATRTTSLKGALSDQRVVAGLGNIYVVEALHRARLSPKRRAATLVTKGGEPTPALRELGEAIADVLKLAIRRQARPGDDNPFTVYGREGERCPRRGCGGTIVRIVQGGRSTFFCPRCQR